MISEIRRSQYLEQLHGFRKAAGVIKVITGMRRCGKSTLMEQFIDDLRREGVDDEHIFYRNFESFDGRGIISREDLEDLLKDLPREGTVYVLLDEVQNVGGWERAVSASEAVENYDIYLTGSNSDMLSSDLATHLSGRYVEVRMLPFSFKEYLEMHPGNREEQFGRYLIYGGLPDSNPDLGERFCRSYLEGVFDSVLVKDVLSRTKTDDVGRLRSIARFLYSNIGNITNKSSISKGTGINPVTVDRYLESMQDALLFYHAEKYDIVGRKLLTTNGKYYASDLGLRNIALEGARTTDISRPLENVVYLELLRRGYTVRTGSYRDEEIDFIAVAGDEVEYYQVSETVIDPDARKRELRSLKAVNDNYPKTILTMDRLGLGNEGGIRIVNVIDWLLS